MKKILILFVLLLGAARASAQVTYLDEPLLTDASFATFTPYSIAGDQGWSHSAVYGAVCSGYSGGQSFENEDWLVGPAMDLAQAGNVTLTFSHTRGSTAVLNVGVAEGWYQVFATANFTGDPVTTNWVELTGVNQSVPVAWTYVSSGALTIPEAAKSAGTRIAFRYRSAAGASATWEIKNVKVTGQGSGGSGIFTITNWNLEWFGCTQFGPSDENLQMQNIASAMLAMDSDIYCVQEVSNTPATQTITNLVALLGESQWEGKIVPLNTGECNQRQAIIYKKARVQFVGSGELSSGGAAEGNSYYYNWTSGRYPALYNVNLVAGSNLVPLSIVNIHAKSEDGAASSYTRRLGGSEGLKTILDYNFDTENLLLIGDFNDYLVGTTSTACNCSLSPYKNFMDDQNYIGLTQSVTGVWGNPLIENMIISDELGGNYIPGSVAQETFLPDVISNYYGTTSDHLPVSVSFQFPTLSNPTFAAQEKLRVFPNPVKDRLHLTNNESVRPQVFDIAGRRIDCHWIDGQTLDTSLLPAGIYLLRSGHAAVKFIKE